MKYHLRKQDFCAAISWYLLPIHFLITDEGTTFRHNGLFLHRLL